MADSYVQYGAVKMEVVHTNTIDRVPVMLSGAHFACVQWDIHIEATYSPGDRGMSYTDVGGVPTKTSGFMPAETDIEIQEYLQTPRRKLTFVDNGITVVASPLDAESCDINNGPFVKLARVSRILGARGWLVSFHVQTWTRACTTRNPLIAHTWRPVVDFDNEGFTTRTISGEAMFNAAILANTGTYPDQYRRDLFHGVPKTFKRERVHVEAADDGTSLIYSVIDREMDNCYGPGCPATKIEAMEANSVQSTGTMQAVSGSAWSAAGNAAGFLASAGVGIGFGWTGIGGVGAGAGMTYFGTNLASNASTAVVAAVNNVPTFKRVISIRLNGSKPSEKWHLVQLGCGIAFARLGSPSSSMLFSLTISHDPLGKYTEIFYSTESTIEGITSWASNQVDVVRKLQRLFPQNKAQERFAPNLAVNVPTNLPNIAGFSDPNGTNPLPPGHGGSRGSWLGQLLTQTFRATNCLAPGRPQDARVDQDTTDLLTS